MDPKLKSLRLNKLYLMVIDGKKSIASEADAKNFLQAIIDQKDRSTCTEKLVVSSQGLQAVKKSLRINTSSKFINETTALFLDYISHEDIRQLCGGQIQQNILEAIIEPPSFWNAFESCFNEKTLSPAGLHSYASLILELLLSPAPFPQLDVRKTAERAISERGDLIDSSNTNIRNVVKSIQEALRARITGAIVSGGAKPGGRHDNDFEDFREIAIFPTTDEFKSKEKPFYLSADEVFITDPSNRVARHLDNQFRLLREDMLGELRTDLQVASGRKRVKQKSLRIKGLSFYGVNCGEQRKRKPPTIALFCHQGLPKLPNSTKDERKKHYKDNRDIVKHQSFGCLLCANEVVAFATVERNEDLLAEEPPVLLLRIFGQKAIKKMLITLKLHTPDQLEFLTIDTAFFAYEPVLRGLQSMAILPLSDELLNLTESRDVSMSSIVSDALVSKVRTKEGCNLRGALKLPKDVVLDQSQTQSLVAGLSQRVSLIQGPPGTGKSFIGAILAKTLHAHSHEKILVLCYTNHALDQFLEDILDIGVSETVMVRLGAKSTERTRSLGLYEQAGHCRLSFEARKSLEEYSHKADDVDTDLQHRSDTFKGVQISPRDMLDYLELAEDDSEFFSAFDIPENDDGMTKIGENGRAISATYLIERWLRGLDAGIFKDDISQENQNVWNMTKEVRERYFQKWVRLLFDEQSTFLQDLIEEYDGYYRMLSKARDDRTLQVLQDKKIIGCTTTAAAKYKQELLDAKPGIILVEEAGEILESHVLTALSPATKHIVLIGDHQQLRPKVNNYALTIEKGHGYDLNRSLFERLVVDGYPHTTLEKQHRMRPEISALVRRLMYPNLEDDPKTADRPPLRGFQSNVIFFNHDQLEVEDKKLTDRRDEGAGVSRQNIFEADIVLKTVRYLAQQGYGTDKQVVLTPYLGQLRLLKDCLSREHDPVLNDMDASDLTKAGVTLAGPSGAGKSRLKISTIDSYQGEESEIVVASLTRSNGNGDIGFMAAPQRLNVLLSRARNGLILIGNAETFTKSRKASKVWVPFITQLKDAGQFYSGLPVKCENHPKETALLKTKEDFDMKCHDGGCSKPCHTLLSCAIHYCPRQCHPPIDHSKVQCKYIQERTCPNSHKVTWECWKGGVPCAKCVQEEKKREAKKKRDHELDLKRQEKEQAYAQQLAELDEEIEHENRLLKQNADDKTRDSVLKQRKKDLEAARKARKDANTINKESRSGDDPRHDDAEGGVRLAQAPVVSSDNSSGAKPGSADQPDINSQAEADWEYQKIYENARNEELDSLMNMIGLETVKQEFINIKNKIDTSIRQKATTKHDRFGASLLGNPGTGKTTVARLYAKFLSSMGVISGIKVEETTGARLAADGVKACQQLIDKLLNAGGGAVFIDEAYQLASKTNIGGQHVLDFLLAEIENLTGKVVFILAGYNKQMETFFAHNPGLPSRFPIELQFADYVNEELRRILEQKIKLRFQGRMKAESGLDGLYCRIVARRVGYGRGKEGFGNARAIENALARILKNQANRLKIRRRKGNSPDDLLLTREDLIGPEPANVLKNNKSWNALQDLTGLDSVKQSVKALFESIQFNYERELQEAPLLSFNLNKVFLGSPGTGKTTVAKLYGKILADMRWLSNGEVVIKNPADFVADVVGGSEKTTQGILAATAGKVLVIDEAYGLYTSRGDGPGAGNDQFKTAVIDTIVAQVQSEPGEDRCVLLLGYKDQMERLFQNVNPGLSRRFPMSEAFEFADFTDDEMKIILDMKLKQQGYVADEEAKKVALDVLKRARNRPNFGNAGEVDILLNGAKGRHQGRRSKGKVKGMAELEAVDMDPDFNRGYKAFDNVQELFRDVIGCDELIVQLEGYQKTVANMKARDLDSRTQIPFNFLFRGPPGTGKTSTARKMGQIYYDMGFLAAPEVIESSATDLIGSYLGHTGPKTQKLLEKSMGKVLLIDEAYRLAEGHFAKEALDEIVDCLTKPTFAQKLIVILAGYEKDINRLMAINPGLTSRFPETMSFRPLTSSECVKLLTTLLTKEKHIETTVLDSPSPAFEHDLLKRFDTLASLPNWANARDVTTISKSVNGQLLRTADPNAPSILLDESSTLSSLDTMIKERANRAFNVNESRGASMKLPMRSASPSSSSPPQSVNTAKQRGNMPASEGKEPPTEPPDPTTPPTEPNEQPQGSTSPSDTPRDPNVSDEVWSQLELDKHIAAEREHYWQTLLKRLAGSQTEDTRKREEDAEAESDYEKKQQDVDRRLAAAPKTENATLEAEREHAKRVYEEERARRLDAERKRREELERLEQIRKRREEERRREKAAQEKLQKMGVCVRGFQWIKQSGGYRCAGGSHFVGDRQLGGM